MKTRALHLLLACASLAVGCADDWQDAPSDEDSASAETSAAPAAQTASPLTVPAEIQSITATGSGCRENSWTSDKGVDANGQPYYEIKFQEYLIRGNAQSDVLQVKDCKIKVQVKVAKGRKYALNYLTIYGRAVLELGMLAEVDVNYGFTGGGLLSSEAKKHVIPGPRPDTQAGFEIPYLPHTELDWSPCETNRALEINTTTTLRNPQKRNGVVEFKQLRGNMSIRFRLVQTAC